MKNSPKLILFIAIATTLLLLIVNVIYAYATRTPIQIGVFNFQNGISAENLKEFENSSGRHIYSVLLYQELTVKDFASFPEKNLNEAILYHETFNSKTVPMITWEPKMTLASIHNGAYDQEIITYAIAANNWEYPLRIRFAHEMIHDDTLSTEGWYSWQDQPTDYKAAFQHIVTIFNDQGANQVEFVWCPNHYPADFETIQKYYPGNEYVDWLCMDGYNWSNQDNVPNQYPDWQSFDQIFSPLYTVFQNEPVFFGQKPIMIGEFSSCEASDHDSGKSKADWITDAFQQIKSEDYSNISAFYWFNADKSSIPNSFECNWRTDSSQTSEVAFRNAISDSIFISHPVLDFKVFLPILLR